MKEYSFVDNSMNTLPNLLENKYFPGCRSISAKTQKVSHKLK